MVCVRQVRGPSRACVVYNRSDELFANYGCCFLVLSEVCPCQSVNRVESVSAFLFTVLDVVLAAHGCVVCYSEDFCCMFMWNDDVA